LKLEQAWDRILAFLLYHALHICGRGVVFLGGVGDFDLHLPVLFENEMERTEKVIE